MNLIAQLSIASSIRNAALICMLFPGTSLAIAETDSGAGAVGAIQQDPMAAGNLLQLILGLAAVLLVIGAIAWATRRMGRFQSAAGGGLRILGGLSMGARERVVLVQVGSRQLLLGVAPGRVQTLHVLEENLGETAPGSEASGFAANLQAALKAGKAS